MSEVQRAAVVRATTLEPGAWAPAVRALRSLGFDAVDVPLVWREHAREGEAPRFDGALDVRAFLDVVAAEGLRAVVRLGPTCAPESPALGVPDAVLRDPRVHARTRRGNPLVAPDGLRLVPLPSLASAAWRAAVARWVAAALDALGPHLGSTVARIIVGPSAFRALRDSPGDRDHHPDIAATGDDLAVERAVARDYLSFLAAAVRAAGVAPKDVVLAAPGHPLAHPAALDAATDHPIFVRAPAPRAGVEGVWRLARLAALLPRGAIVEVASGGPPFQSPARATHALQTARVVAAAGVASLTVAAGCVGHRWPGALLDERGDPRAHAARWADFVAASRDWPVATAETERGAVIAVDADRVARWRASPALGVLPRSELVARGLHPAALGGETDDEVFARERALTASATPWRYALRDGNDHPAGEGFTVRVEPAGAALVRAVEGDEGRRLVLVSASEETARVTLADGWRDESGAWCDRVEVPEGAVRALRSEVPR